MENPYEILGIDADSDLKTIRNAYFKLLKKYRQDINKDKKAEEMTKKINVAYTMILEGVYIPTNDSNIEKYKEDAIEEINKLEYIIPELIEFYIEKINNSKAKDDIEDYLEIAQNYDKLHFLVKALIEKLNIASVEELEAFSTGSMKTK